MLRGILTAQHDMSSPDFAGLEKPVRLGDRVFVGTRAMILPGVTIGAGAVVTAGAVVRATSSPTRLSRAYPPDESGSAARIFVTRRSISA